MRFFSFNRTYIFICSTYYRVSAMTMIYYIGLTKDEDNFINQFREDLADCELKLGFAKDLMKDFKTILDPATIKDFEAFLTSAEYLINHNKILLKQIKTDEIKVKNDE